MEPGQVGRAGQDVVLEMWLLMDGWALSTEPGT